MSELAIFGGEKTREENYPAWPVFDEKEVEKASISINKHESPASEETKISSETLDGKVD